MRSGHAGPERDHHGRSSCALASHDAFAMDELIASSALGFALQSSITFIDTQRRGPIQARGGRRAVCRALTTATCGFPAEDPGTEGGARPSPPRLKGGRRGSQPWSDLLLGQFFF
ncbi:hypothetical protein GQ53DRAFT_440457 [Thozetella sp. PMI_491]|nr:hypothetical protein GQ53DRAFT_440457 [Thozetella sp. PMI_491]